MSLPRKMTVNCTKCGHPIEVTVFESVNTDYAEDIAMQIISGELFNAECPNCKYVSHMEYDLLYNDMRHEAMIWVIHKGKPGYESKLEEVRSTQKLIPNHTLRIVEDMNALKEKVSCLERGRDDRIIEMCKFFILGNLLSQHPDFDFRNAFYTILSGKEMIYFYDVEGNFQCCELQDELYDYIKTLYFSNPCSEQFDDNYAIVDLDWAEETLMPLIEAEADRIDAKNADNSGIDDAGTEEVTELLVCPECKNKLPKDSKFCQYCGYSIKDNAAKEASVLEKTFAVSTKPLNVQPAVISKSAPAKSPDKQRFCKYCGGVIDGESKKCTSCGKQYFKLPKTQSKAFLAVIIAMFVLLSVGGFFGFNYYKGIDAMHNQRFIVAQQYFDNLIVGKKLFPEEYAYIEAGVLMEEGKYIESYSAFNNLDGIAVPASISESLRSKIYSTGQTAYRSGKYTTAEENFNAIRGYKRSDNYLTLIACHTSSSWVTLYNYDKLITLIGFEDADEIILKDEDMAEKFLEGKWKDGDKGYYFYMLEESDGSLYCRHNLPQKSASGYYYISDSIYSVGKTEAEAVKLYKFLIVDEDTISVYCYKDGKTYILHRQ